MENNLRQVLVFHHTLAEREELDAVLSKFKEHGYVVTYIDVEQDPDFHLHALPAIIAELIPDPDNTRIIIVSNIRTALFAWFRICNRMADDFVYFIDNPESGNYQETVLADVFSQLATFNGISAEKPEGKIYLNISPNNYKQITDFLFSGDNIDYFDVVKNFDYHRLPSGAKKPSSCSYLHAGQSYSFVQNTDITQVQINLGSKNSISKAVDSGIMPAWGVSIALLTGRINFCKSEDQKFLDRPLEDRKIIFDNLMQFLTVPDSFFDKGLFAIACVCLKIDGVTAVNKTMELILSEETKVASSYQIFLWFTNMLDQLSIKPYPAYFCHRRQFTDMLANYYIKQLKQSKDTSQKIKSGRKSVVFLLHRIGDPKYALTRMMIDFILVYIETERPGAVLILVEELFQYNPKDITYPISAYVAPTTQVELDNNEDKFAEIRSKTKLELFITDVSKPRATRIREIIDKIQKFAPDYIIHDIADSVTARILYDKYPLIFLASGDRYTFSRADCFLVPNKKNLLEQNNEYGNLLPEESMQELHFAIEVPKTTIIIDRSIIAKSEEIIILTASNRLNTDMNVAFIDMFATLLERQPGLKWLLAGFEKPSPYFFEKCSELIVQGRVKYRGYEEDMVALLKVCDICAYPYPATGGGLVVSYAMNLALPVAIMGGYVSDGVHMTGEENISGTTLDEYARDIERLASDPEYRKERGTVVNARYEKSSSCKPGEAISEGVAMALRNYQKRIKG